VNATPLIESKFYAASQVMDEARHVEVYARYLREKLSGAYPINRHLRALLDQILTDSRWDMKYLGMQIMVEGLAMAAFGYMHKMCNEPLLTELTHYVMKDESRHVAFGVLSLNDYFGQLSAAERREREEFLYEGCRSCATGCSWRTSGRSWAGRWTRYVRSCSTRRRCRSSGRCSSRRSCRT
jgi:hypothetical protein